MNKIFMKITLMGLIITLFSACGGGGLNGTYVAQNDAAKQSMYSEFVFKGKKVRVVMGAMGIKVPGGYEYDFSKEGNQVKIEMRIMGTSMGGIDLDYNEDTDELRLLFEGETGKELNQYAPVWAKEGKVAATTPKKKEGNSIVKFFKRIFGGKDKSDESKKPVDTPVIEENKTTSPKEQIESVQQPVTEKESTASETNTIQSTQSNKSQPVKPAYTPSQLSNLLNSIANSNDAARDQMSKLNNVKVNGAANISNVQQLIIDVSNGTRYKVTDVQTDSNGKVISITVSK